MLIGTVQAMLLEAIRATGSISPAQRQIGASYAHVWKLVAAMNEALSPQLVDPIRGGVRCGGAILTEQGHKVLDTFRRLEKQLKRSGHAELLVISRAASQAVAGRQ